MQEHDDNSKALTPAENTINGSKLKVWKRRIEIIVLVATSVGLLVWTSWFIYPYINHKPPALQFLGYSSAIFLAIGNLVLIIAPKISKIIGTESQQLSYIAVFASAILLLLSLFGLGFIIKPERRWLEYVYPMILVAGVIIMTLSKIISKQQKRLINILESLTLILLITTLLLSFLVAFET